jgi:PTS system mannitol-specific IIC component
METKSPSGVRTRKIQQLGRFLSGMVMPNIGAFIAWGLLTALFIPSGWLPNETLARLVDPMITYLLPLLIGYSGGKMICGHRGGVVAAVATMGMIVGTSIPMFLGAMIMGPLAGWTIQQIDARLERHIPTGFEMLVHNFSAGLTGGLLAVCACAGIGSVVEFLSHQLALMVGQVVRAGALPAVSLLIEPAKILFLNNAVNHGVLGPLGVDQATEAGRSILFLLETNPGPGLGILLVYLVYTKGTARQSVPGAMLIHFFGGIHEIYFPYVLMQPKLLLALIAGGVSGVFTFSALGAGLVAVPSPGSIVALAAMAPRGGLLPVLAGVVVSTAVTFCVGAMLVDRKMPESNEELGRAKERLAGMKAKKVRLGHDCIPDELTDLSTIKCIAVACDGGMGSSVMGASKLRAVFAEHKVGTKVISCAIDQLDDEVDLVITHRSLTGRAVEHLPGAAHVAITDLLNTPVYAELAQRLAQTPQAAPSAPEKVAMSDLQILKPESIRMGLPAMSRDEAIRLAGQILVEGGYVGEEYIDAMLEREAKLSTYLGHGIAIPHGGSEAKKKIERSGISVLQFPDGVDFDGETAHLVVGIAGRGNQHLSILAGLAKIVQNDALMELLCKATDRTVIYGQLTGRPDETPDQ